jgi:hypothetical protein
MFTTRSLAAPMLSCQQSLTPQVNKSSRGMLSYTKDHDRSAQLRILGLLVSSLPCCSQSSLVPSPSLTADWHAVALISDHVLLPVPLCKHVLTC